MKYIQKRGIRVIIIKTIFNNTTTVTLIVTNIQSNANFDFSITLFLFFVFIDSRVFILLYKHFTNEHIECEKAFQ